jgi:hypothetical protein
MGNNKLKKDNKIILEDLGDYNPIEILRTAGKYYIDLAKSPNPREQFRKDLKDAGVDDYLQGASAIPFIGMPFGIASIGLNLGAGNTQQALIQAIITASATLGVSAAGKGFQSAASNPKVAQAVARIIQSVSDKMGRLPAIGPKIVTAVGAMRGQLDDLLAELVEIATEEEIAKAEAESNRIKGALDKLAASQPAKKIKKSTAANRKDVTEMRELLRKRRIQENSQVKITKNLLRRLIKEQIENKLLVEDLNPMAVAQRISLAIAGAKLGADLRKPLAQTGVDIAAMHSAAFKGDDPVKERLKKLVAISSDEEVQKAHDALYKMATGEDEATKEYAKQIRDNMPIFSEDGSLAARLRVSRKGPASGANRVRSPEDLIKWYASLMGDKE